MARNAIARHIWIIDMIEQYHALSLNELNRLWLNYRDTDRKELSRRTFYNYRKSIEETFGIYIRFNAATNEYYIDHSVSDMENRRQQWLLNQMSISTMLADSADIKNRIVLENVPSAREYLPLIVDAMRQNVRIRFTYTGYQRSRPVAGIVLEPYFAKIFKQVWYVIGRNVAENKIKTYALDRMSAVELTVDSFTPDNGVNPDRYFKDCYGITSSADEPKEILLRVDATQAKYFRAVPLHHSQREIIHDNYSLFSYRMCNTYDLRERLLSHGPAIEVIKPQELRLQIKTALAQALAQYN